MSEDIIMWVAVLGAISEGLSMIPTVKANGIFQAVYSLLKSAKSFISNKKSK